LGSGHRQLSALSKISWMCCKLQKKKITFNEITGLHIQLQQKIFNVRCAGAIAGNCDIKVKTQQPK
jgi:hypothetical protein